MAFEEVTAQLGNAEDAPSATVRYDFGDDLEDAAEKFGSDVVFTRYRAACRIDLQSLIRRALKSEKNSEEIQAQVEEWRPGVSNRTRKSKAEKAKEAVDALSDEDKAALLEQLMGEAA